VGGLEGSWRALKFSGGRVFAWEKLGFAEVFLGFEDFFQKSPCTKGLMSISFSSLADLSLGDASRQEQPSGGELDSTESRE